MGPRGVADRQGGRTALKHRRPIERGQRNMDKNIKKIMVSATAGIAAAASMAAPAFADETAVTPDEQAGKALE